MMAQRIARLRRLHGLTASQAALVAARLWGGGAMMALRIAKLRTRYGLTVAQAALVAALCWGAANG